MFNFVRHILFFMDLEIVLCSRLMFNPQESEFLNKFVDYPEFSTEYQDKMALPKKNLFTFISIMYDINSNMRDKFPNHWQRKRMCAEFSGFKLTSQRKFDKPVEQMLFGLNVDVNRMVVRFLSLFDDPDYMTLMTYWEMFIKETTMSMALMESKDIKESRQNISFFNEHIRTLTNKLFGGEEARGMVRELYRNLSDEMLRLRPELMAEDLKSKNPSINPHDSI